VKSSPVRRSPHPPFAALAPAVPAAPAEPATLAAALAVLLLALASGALGCRVRGASPTAAGDGRGRVHVGIVFDTAGKDDRSFNAAAWAGCRRAVRELPIVLRDAEPGDPASISRRCGPSPSAATT
jgi:hypothetical protein